MAATILHPRQVSSAIQTNTQTGTSYTLVASDSGKEVRTTNAAAKTITIPSTGTLGTDFICSLANLGAGALAIVPDTGVTLRNDIQDIAQYKNAVIRAIGTNEYLITSDEVGAGGGSISKSVAVEQPTNAEDISMFFTDEAITITKMAAVLRGSATPSVTWTIRHSTDRSAAGNEVVTSGTTTTSTTTGSVVTSFNDATIPADSYVWLETTGKSGTVDELNVTVIFTKD